VARLDIGPGTASGAHTDHDGVPFDFIANPTLGLWTSTPLTGGCAPTDSGTPSEPTG